MATIHALTLDEIDALTITASDARPSDTDAADGVDVTITVSGEPVGTITGTVTVTPMASGQGYAANAQSLDIWIAAGPLLDLLEAQPTRERRALAQAIEMAASRAAEDL